MNAVSPLRLSFSRCNARTQPCLQRNFRSSGFIQSPCNKSSVPTKTSKKKKSGLSKDQKPKRKRNISAEDFKLYSEEDKALLKESYTPAQLEAIEAGEAAIDREDLARQATLRNDPFAFAYYDDFAKIHPVVDNPVRPPKGKNYDPKQRLKTEDEITEDLAKFVQNMPEEPSRLDYMKYIDNVRLTKGKEEAERNPRSSLAPEIPKGLEALKQPGTRMGEADINPSMKRLMKQTGFSFEDIRKLRVKNLVTHRVVNQTKMGKIQSMYFLNVAGNGKGLLGIGEGKSTELEDAKTQAHHNAIRNLQPIPRYENRTIFGDVKVKMGAVEVELMTRPPGTCSKRKPILTATDNLHRLWS